MFIIILWTNNNPVLTSESPADSVDYPQNQTVASLLNPAGHCNSAPVLSDGRGWTSELRPEKHSWSRIHCNSSIWIKNKLCLIILMKVLSHPGNCKSRCCIVGNWSKTTRPFAFNTAPICLTICSELKHLENRNCKLKTVKYKNLKRTQNIE